MYFDAFFVTSAENRFHAWVRTVASPETQPLPYSIIAARERFLRLLDAPARSWVSERKDFRSYRFQSGPDVDVVIEAPSELETPPRVFWSGNRPRLYMVMVIMGSNGNNSP